MILLPAPRRLEMTEGAFVLPRWGFVQLFSTPTDLLPAAKVIRTAVQEAAGAQYGIVAGGPEDDVVIDLLLSSHLPHQQGYEIEIEPNGIHVTAATAEGAFYAAQTLAQIICQHADLRLPCMQIEDRPDFR